MNGIVTHRHMQLRSGEWLAEFILQICQGATLHSLKFLDPRPDLRFETEEEAIWRNRSLAGNWRDANLPDLELFESRV